MQHDTFTKGDELYIWSKATGYMKAWAGEDKPERFGGLAYFKVTLNSKALPGVSEMTINLNTFDAYHADNPEVLKKIAATFIEPEWTR